MTEYSLEMKKMNEKTFPVNVGQDIRDMIREIQDLHQHRSGFPCTQRAVVTLSVKDLYKRMKRAEAQAPKPENQTELYDLI